MHKTSKFKNYSLSSRVFDVYLSGILKLLYSYIIGMVPGSFGGRGLFKNLGAEIKEGGAFLIFPKTVEVSIASSQVTLKRR